jgi:hypothetical protein
MSDHMAVLTLGVLARFVTTHDLPGIFAAAVQSEPWRRERNGKLELWRDGLWNEDNGGITSIFINMQILSSVDNKKFNQHICRTTLYLSLKSLNSNLLIQAKYAGTSIEKMEGQTWICLYNLLSCKEVMDKYQINDFRVGVLIKLQSR